MQSATAFAPELTARLRAIRVLIGNTPLLAIDCAVEATSGNTGISMAAMGGALGHPVTIIMPDWMSEERRSLMRGFGATVRLVATEMGGFLGSIQLAEELAMAAADAFLPRQFENAENAAAHEATTGPELLAQMRWHGLPLDAFVAGVGTGGTIMGVVAALMVALRMGKGATVATVFPDCNKKYLSTALSGTSRRSRTT